MSRTPAEIIADLKARITADRGAYALPPRVAALLARTPAEVMADYKARVTAMREDGTLSLHVPRLPGHPWGLVRTINIFHIAVYDILESIIAGEDEGPIVADFLACFRQQIVLLEQVAAEADAAASPQQNS